MCEDTGECDLCNVSFFLIEVARVLGFLVRRPDRAE